MKKSKVASSDLPRTSPQAMAPAPAPEPNEEDKLRKGGYDLDHLMGAEEIKNDPERMKYVGKAHEGKMKAMRSIADLKIAGQALAQQKTDELKAKPAHPRNKIRYPEK